MDIDWELVMKIVHIGFGIAIILSILLIALSNILISKSSSYDKKTNSRNRDRILKK